MKFDETLRLPPLHGGQVGHVHNQFCTHSPADIQTVADPLNDAKTVERIMLSRSDYLLFMNMALNEANFTTCMAASVCDLTFMVMALPGFDGTVKPNSFAALIANQTSHPYLLINAAFIVNALDKLAQGIDESEGRFGEYTVLQQNMRGRSYFDFLNNETRAALAKYDFKELTPSAFNNPAMVAQLQKDAQVLAITIAAAFGSVQSLWNNPSAQAEEKRMIFKLRQSAELVLGVDQTVTPIEEAVGDAILGKCPGDIGVLCNSAREIQIRMTQANGKIPNPTDVPERIFSIVRSANLESARLT